MRKCLCLSLLLATLAVAQTTHHSASEIAAQLSPTGSPAYTPQSTCESRLINYITHTLPQQCLNAAAYTGASHAAPQNSSTSETAIDKTHLSAQSTSTDRLSNTDVASAPTETSVTVQTSSPTPSATDRPETISATTSASPVSATEVGDTDSVLDDAQFLSFEDWKSKTLEQVGQDSEKLGSGRAAGSTSGEPRRRPGSNDALEGLGDEAEIEIDFAGFRATSQNRKDPRQSQQSDQQGKASTPLSEDGADMLRIRSKDAGKTCKERFNYASFDCAANVLKTNGKVKHASSILVENKDSYMTSECSVDNKFVIVELCDDALIDTVVLANYEFFASSFHTFRISVSSNYPVKLDKWIPLGTFEARNTREIQAFLIENPQIYARYLRVEFLTHYGNQYFCPLSLLRVHGMTMFDHYKLWQQVQQGEIDPDGEAEAEEEMTAVASGSEPPVVQASKPVESAQLSSTETAPAETAVTSVGRDQHQSATISSSPGHSGTAEERSHASRSGGDEVCDQVPLVSALASLASPLSECVTWSTTALPPSSISTTSDVAASVVAARLTPRTTSSAESKQPTTPATTPSSSSTQAESSSAAESFAGSNSSTSSPPTTRGHSVSSTVTATPIPTSSVAGAPAPPATAHVPAQPATQESFFKSIHKRLQALESNSTLSMQYIESQSQILREAFAKVDKRNIAKTSEFLERLNTTVLAELSRFKTDYEQLWQSTVLELASQRDEGRRERELLSDQVKLLADEVVSQKRLQAAQATLLLLCLGFVVFARIGASGVADTAFVQNVQGFVLKQRRRHMKTDSFGRRWPWESPWISPAITRPTSRRGAVPDAELDESPVGGADSSDNDEAGSREGERQGFEDEPESSASIANGHLTHGSLKMETRSAPTTPRLERDKLDLTMTENGTVS